MVLERRLFWPLTGNQETETCNVDIMKIGVLLDKAWLENLLQSMYLVTESDIFMLLPGTVGKLNLQALGIGFVRGKSYETKRNRITRVAGFCLALNFLFSLFLAIVKGLGSNVEFKISLLIYLLSS